MPETRYARRFQGGTSSMFTLMGSLDSALKRWLGVGGERARTHMKKKRKHKKWRSVSGMSAKKQWRSGELTSDFGQCAHDLWLALGDPQSGRR